MAKPLFTLGKKEEKKQEEVEVIQPEAKPEPVYTHEALGTFKDEKTGEWMVSVIKYNPVTKESAYSESIHSGGGKDFAIEKFKIAAIHRGVVG